MSAIPCSETVRIWVQARYAQISNPTKGNVVVKSDEIYETGLRKFGAILGDGTDIGCGSVLNPGTVIGRESSVYPLTSVRGVIPCGCIVKSSHETVVRKISDKEENR